MNIKKLVLPLAAMMLLSGCSGCKGTEEPVKSPDTTPQTVVVTPEPVDTSDTWPEELGDPQVYKDLYKQIKESKEINQDVVGWIYFPSGLVSQPVLHGTDNAFYLRHDWKTGQPLEWGSIYADFRNNISNNDMNTILYGNYVYKSYSSDRTLVFTPLAELREEKNYEPNKYVTLITETEIRLYELAHVFDCPTVYISAGQVPAEGFEFNELTFTDEKLVSLVNNIKGIEFYHTGVEIEPGDRMLMMQTCVEFHTEVRQINVCREIGRYPIPEE